MYNTHITTGVFALMASLVAFVRSLLQHGCARLSERPRLHANQRTPLVELLAAAYRDHVLDIAGTPPTFAPAVALRTAEWAANACWLLVNRAEAEQLDAALPLFAPSPDAGDHATADVLLRLFPSLLRRARVSEPGGPLARRIEELLRTWPLSGLLADIEAEPLTPVELGGHPGLLMLYAERYAQRPRPAWFADAAAPYIEVALAERNVS